MVNSKIREYLAKQHINYTEISHSPAFTAQEVAATAHVSGKKLAKVVIVKSGDKLAMIVLPAHEYINFSALKSITHEQEIDLATESSFKAKFPECEVGAMPPFGNLYDMPVYVSSQLCAQEYITFNAGTHSELLRMAYLDFERLVHPKVIATR